MQELLIVALVLCLPLAVWTGYRLAKRQQHKQTYHLPDQYLAGLNYLLNEQPDKAIDVFIEQLSLDSEVVETHLALGNLFRRRGEVDRAIRIHQNIIARPSLTARTRKLALKELADDYMAAGLYDRAENLFSELLSDSEHKQQALESLISVYQQLHDWSKAIKCANQLNHTSGKIDSRRIAHYYCEIASEAFDEGSTKRGLEALKKATAIETHGLRQNMMLAEHHMQQADYKRALKLYRNLVTDHGNFLSEFLDDLHRCHIQLGTEKQFIDDLGHYIRASHNLDALLLFSSLSQKNNSPEQQIAMLEDFCQTVPTAAALMHLLAHYRDHSSGSERNRYQQLYNMLSNQVSQTMKYECTHCGYQSMTLFWQCPTCKEWGTMQPDNQLVNH